MLCWQHVILMSLAKAGCKIVDLDTEITDINDIREALRISECRLINFASETSHDRTMLLRKAIPEFYHCEKLCPCLGQPTHSL